MIAFDEFSSALHDAHDRWIRRRAEIGEQTIRSRLLVFGYGGKGRTLAEQLRRLSGRDVYVFDTSDARRALARSHEFAVLDALPDPGSGFVTVLAACQAQREQRSLVASEAIYFQEAATFFELPHLGHLASDFQRTVTATADALYDVYGTLHPDSRERFLAILRFRASADPMELAAARAPVDAMWIDVPRQRKTHAYRTVMDVGAFDGDTLRVFRECFAAERGIAVEANLRLFDAIRTVSAAYPRDVTIVPFAAWSKETRLAFEEVRAGMIRVDESPTGELAAARLDAHVHEPIDFLKMDIEGAEGEALSGCLSIIRNSQPDLALAAYHRPDDLVDLVRHCRALGCNADRFEWHVGHYSDCLDDTILYAIKR